MKKIATFLLAAVFMFSLVGCSEETYSSVETENSTESNVEQVIYEDDTLKAVYLGVSENSGMQLLNVRLENKTDDEITVLPMDSSVNDTSVQFTSGVLATIQAGKMFNQSWIVGSNQVKTLEFSMSVNDKDMSEIARTELITINVKE